MTTYEDDYHDDEDEGANLSLIESTALEFGNKADWRRGKARQYPDDERNLDAAELLDRLAGEILALAGTAAAEALEQAYGAAFAEQDDDRAIELMRLWAEYRAGIGFRLFPDSGEVVLRDLTELAKTTEG